MASTTSDSNPAQAVPSDLKDRLKASYDAIAPEYNEWTVRHHAQRLQYLEKILAPLLDSNPSGQLRVLELGCGSGVPVTEKLLSYANVHVTANDISTAQIELARAHLLGSAEANASERLDLVEGDMTKLEFPDGSLDAVVAFYSIIHLPREEQTEMIGKIARWLKPGGYFLANFSQGEAESVVMDKWLGEKGWAFWSGWGKEATLKIVEEAGLHVELGEVSGHDTKELFLWVIAKRADH
ncbi:methyltransferase domain-containing protein [Hypoxylon rubiginosum]|uniref:Methyltransferase domain-containing protein n=1 Tax=Hypoxylon rubiginosum TaxID=110542 RepID=A0ACC0D3Q4_9PEZI|nr:methyltransferase domain-containing protein [Hypoxylon rubiginosum]